MPGNRVVHSPLQADPQEAFLFRSFSASYSRFSFSFILYHSSGVAEDGSPSSHVQMLSHDFDD